MIEMEYTERLKDPLVLEDGQYKGYNFWIISYGTHPCAYVEIPKGHPYYGKCDCEAFDLPIDVHGGITYGDYGLHPIVDTEKFLLGWDYNHYEDYSCKNHYLFMDNGKMWTTEEILEEVKYVIKQLIEKVQMKQITIYDLLPLLKSGWVAMDEDGTWCWFKSKPSMGNCGWCSLDYEYSLICLDYCFKKLAPFDGSWKDSLIKVEHKEEE